MNTIAELQSLKRLILFFINILNALAIFPRNVLVQLVEKLSYDKNSSVNFNNIKRFETELKWIKLLHTVSPLGLNDNIYHEGNISKMPDFDVFSLLETRKRKSTVDLMVKGKKEMSNVKDLLHKNLALPLMTYQLS